MAEAVVGSLVYQFKADIADLKSGFSNINSEIAKLKTGIGSANDNLRRTGTEAAKSIGLARHEMVNLSRQITDVGVSLASGQSPFMVLIQQGAQIADVFGSSKAGAGAALKGFASQIASMAMSSRTAIGLLVASVAAIGVTAYSAEKNLEKLSDTAKALGSNRGAVNEFNRQASIIGVDPEKMNEELVALAMRLREAQIAGGDLAEKLGRVGININNFDLSKPGEFIRLFSQIAEKVRNSGNELDKLNALKLLGLSNEFLRVFDKGSEAVRKFANDSKNATESSAKSIEDKWRDIAKFASDTWKIISDAAINIAHGALTVISSIIDKIAELFNYAKKQWNDLKAFMGFGGEGETAAPASGGKGLGIIDVSKPGGKTDISAMFAKTPKSGRRSAGAGGGRDAIKEYIESLREASQLAKAEADNWSLGNEAREKATAIAKAESIAAQEKRTLTAEQRLEIENLAGSQARYKDQVDKLKEAQDNLNQAMSEFADTASNALEDLIIRGGKAKDVLKELVQTLASSALRGLVTGDGMFGQLMGLGGKDGKTGGLFGMLAGGISAASGGGLFGGLTSLLPKFAAGGSLGAGKWGIAGEAGPELVQGPASISPMGGNNGKVIINNYAGAEVSAQRLSSGDVVVMIQQALNQYSRKVPGLVADAQRRSI